MSTKVVGTKMSEKPTEGDTTTFAFSFDPEVVIQTSEYLTFNWTTFFADLGGSLGLWLGIGVSQVMELLARYFINISRSKNPQV